MQTFDSFHRLQNSGSVRSRAAVSAAALAIVLNLFSAARADFPSQTVDSFPLSLGPADSAPDAAYNSANDSWLVVWKEESDTFAGPVHVVMGRIVTDAGEKMSDAFAISPPGANTSDPRVAYDQYWGEWVVVWAGGIHPLLSQPQLRVRRVGAFGALFGTGPRLVSGGEGIANPDVVADLNPESPSFMLAWEESDGARQRIHAQAFAFHDAQVTGTAPISPVFDLTSNLDSEDADGRYPRLSRVSPVTEDGVAPLVTFRLDHETYSEVRLTEILDDFSSGRRVARVDPASRPSVAYNAHSQQAMVTFDSDLEGPRTVYANKFFWDTERRYFVRTSATPFPLLGGERPDVHASLQDDTFVLATDGGGSVLAHVAGFRVLESRTFSRSSDQSRLVIGEGDIQLMLWRRDEPNARSIEAATFRSPEALVNRAPEPVLVAPEFVEAGQDFTLDASESFDPDGDPRTVRWVITGGLKIAIREPHPEQLELTAPELTEDQESDEILVELTVMDHRVDPSAAPVVTARVTVVPAGFFGTRFFRGDANASGDVDLSDAISILNGLFVAGERITCADAADANDDGDVDLSDPIFVLNYLFVSGDEPLAPGTRECDLDPTEDDLAECEVSFCGVH